TIGNYTRDHDVTITQSIKDRADRVRPGWVRFPSSLYMRNGLGAFVKRDSRSPYEVRETVGRFALYDGEEKVEDIWFPGAADGEPGSEGFWPGALYSGANKNCGIRSGANAPILPQSQHCGYFATGDQCKFCNYNSNHDDALASGLRPDKATIDDAVEHYRLRASKRKIVEICVGSDGAVTDPQARSRLTDYYFGYVEKLVKATPSYHPVTTLITMPLTRTQLQRLKDIGCDCVRSQMEVWDPQLFPEIVPGKSKQFGHAGYTEHLQNAVDILGPGNAMANFVAGVTLMPKNGHQTWQEARDSMVEGFRWLIKNDIACGFPSLRPVPGSIYGDDKSNLAKLPPTDFYLELAQGHHGVMSEYGFYDKINKFMMCPLCLLPAYYLGELGMIELAGTPGNWLADKIPDEVNWLAQFTESLGSTVGAVAGGQLPVN
ncbi:MAG: hypothetical protein Q7O66_04700, partial [Dehalococcoidia bacterium]|nr:hypothetical protein [Dehalococcoidia bacterium]